MSIRTFCALVLARLSIASARVPPLLANPRAQLSRRSQLYDFFCKHNPHFFAPSSCLTPPARFRKRTRPHTPSALPHPLSPLPSQPLTEVDATWADVNAARQHLCWQPRVRLEEVPPTPQSHMGKISKNIEAIPLLHASFEVGAPTPAPLSPPFFADPPSVSSGRTPPKKPSLLRLSTTHHMY